MVIVAQFGECAKKLKYTFKCVNCILCELYLNEIVTPNHLPIINLSLIPVLIHQDEFTLFSHSTWFLSSSSSSRNYSVLSLCQMPY